MGKKKLCTNIIVGAFIGGFVALTDRNVRTYVKSKAVCCSSKGKQFLKSPSGTIRDAKEAFQELTESISNQADQLLNAVEQVEETVSSITKKTD